MRCTHIANATNELARIQSEGLHEVKEAYPTVIQVELPWNLLLSSGVNSVFPTFEKVDSNRDLFPNYIAGDFEVSFRHCFFFEITSQGDYDIRVLGSSRVEDKNLCSNEDQRPDFPNISVTIPRRLNS